MKLKYVLFSGLLLSVGFTACTNEDFTEAISPVSTEGIALDEVTVNVGNGVDTKAALGSDYKPTWEEGDLLGAARFHAITVYDEEDGVTGVAGALDAFKANHTLELTEGIGTNNGTFTTQDSKGLEAGAHVLYYPQYTDITPVGKDVLPVAIKTYGIDCANPMWNLNENMFAYSAVKFVPGQKSIDDYTLRQVPVLYNLYFEASEHLTQNLDGPITIKHIVVEAWKGGNAVTTELGQVVTKGGIPAAADYNNDDLNKYIKYQDDPTDNNVDHLFYDVANSNSSDYQLITKGVKTVKGFKFMALPWSDKADLVIIKAVTDKGTFTKTYKAGDKNEAGTEYLKKFNEEATAEGGQISLNVILDTTEEDEVIYTAEQMKDVMANIEAGETYHWIMGEPITVDADLKVAENATVYISRYPLTVNSLDVTEGKLVVLNDLTVKGNVLIDSNSKGFEAGTSATLERPDKTTQTLSGGKLTVGGKLTIGGGTGGDVKITLAKSGDIQINTSGIATITGVSADPANEIEATTMGNINNEGQLTLANIAIPEGKTLTIAQKEGTVTPTLKLGDDAVVNEGTIVNKGSFNMNNFDFTNKGTFDNYSTISGTGKTFANEAGATLNINNSNANTNSYRVNVTNAAATSEDEAAVINVAKEAKLTVGGNYPILNDGIVNVYGEVVEELQALRQTDADARINVADTGSLTLHGGNTGVDGGYIMPTVDAEVLGNSTNNPEAPVAAVVTASTDLVNKVNPAVNTYIMSGNFEFTCANAASYNTKTLVFNGGTVTLEDGLTFNATKAVIFNGSTTLKNGAEDLATATGATFTLTNWAANRVNAGTLTVGNEVKLDLATNSAQLHVTNGAGIKTAKADAEDPAIGAGAITGDTNIDFELE